MIPRIGITGLTRTVDRRRLTGVGQAYVSSVCAAGGLPLVLPPMTATDYGAAAAATLDGLILSGGADVDPAHYGAVPHPALGPVEPDRDAFELTLVAAARDLGLPILAICRGMQLVNVALGGTLWQDLPTERPGNVEHHPNGPRTHRAHRVDLVRGTAVASATDATSLEVNSLHHQGIRDLAPGLRATGHAPDGLVEAIEASAGGWLVGVQWHPEAFHEEPDSPDQHLFRSLIAAAGPTRERRPLTGSAR